MVDRGEEKEVRGSRCDRARNHHANQRSGWQEGETGSDRGEWKWSQEAPTPMNAPSPVFHNRMNASIAPLDPEPAVLDPDRELFGMRAVADALHLDAADVLRGV